MKPTVFVPGTLCDHRVFGALPDRVRAPVVVDYSAFSSARAAAVALLPSIPKGSLGISFSLGGWILLEMLRLDPDRFDAILLISGNAHPDASGNAEVRRARVARARVNGFQSVFAEEFDDALGALHREDPDIRDVIVEMAEDMGHDAHAHHAEINIARPDLRGFVADPPRPIHVLAGAQDGLCPRDRYELAAAGPHCRLMLVEGAGHYLPLEDPEAIHTYARAHFPEHLQ